MGLSKTGHSQLALSDKGSGDRQDIIEHSDIGSQIA